MVGSINLKQFSDLNNDGKVNDADRHMAAGGGDANGDGKITTEDFFYVRNGKEDYNKDGKIDWLDVHQANLTKNNIFDIADTNNDGKLSSNEWQIYQYSKFDDVNNDGKKNWHDSWITQTMNKLGITDAFELDKNKDGKLNTEDYWMSKGYADYNSDGKVDMQDKVYKDTYGDIDFDTLQGEIKNTDFSKLSEKINNNLPEFVGKSESQKKLNVLNYSLDRLSSLQESLGIKPREISTMLEGMVAEFKLDDVASVDANLFNSTEIFFLEAQGSLKLTNPQKAEQATPTTPESPAVKEYNIEIEKIESNAGYKNTLLALNKNTGDIATVFNNATSASKGTTISIDLDLTNKADLDLLLLANGWSNSNVQEAVTNVINDNGELIFEDGVLYFVSDDGTRKEIDVNIYHSQGLSADGLDHAREEGNLIKFEDLWNGGDKDYDDLVVKMNLS